MDRIEVNTEEEGKSSVLIIGGGIGGMDCALDLANANYNAYIIEKKPIIGGVYAQIYKIFPFDECSACVLTPKTNSIYRHPLINILTLTEIERVEGTAGNFKVFLQKKPRYVDETKCTGCQ
ncbi:MAG: NAD(P)-binding protein, partial [Candidatus Helarchaeota archaeon]